MKRKLIAILAAVTLLCSVFVGMTFSASAEGERGFGMSKSEWKDFFGQVKEYDDGIGIGADANLQLPLYGETISLAMQFSIVPDTDFWYVLAFANNADFSAGSVHTGPNTGCFVIMMQPGADSMNFNVFHWKEKDGALARTDIALGALPVEGGLQAGVPFTVDIALFGENPSITVKQGDKTCVYDKGSHAELANISRAQISDAYGRTYLNTASYAAGEGTLKELKFTSISTLGGVEDVRNWSGAGISAVSGGVQLTGSAQYLRAVDMSSKYLKLTLDVKMIIGNVDAWIALGFGKTPALPTAN